MVVSKNNNLSTKHGNIKFIFEWFLKKFMLDKDFDEVQAKAEYLDEADDWGP